MAKQSLASKLTPASPPPVDPTAVVESNNGASCLPAAFQKGGALIEVGDRMYQRTAYVVFASNKSPNFMRFAMAIPDLNDSDPVFVRPEPLKPVKLSPFKYYLIRAWQHFSVVDPTGAILESSTDIEFVKANQNRQTRRFDEHIETFILVLHEGKLFPARCTFKTTKTNAAFRAIETLKDAEDSATWGTKSPEHKASLVAEEPWARFITTVKLKPPKTGGGGFVYTAADAFCTPTGIADWQALGEFFSNDENVKAAQTCLDQFAERNAMIASKGA